jgi:hypothetical protein
MTWMEYSKNFFATLDIIFVDVEHIFPCVYGWMNNKWTFGWNIYEKCYLFKMFGQHMFMTKDLKDQAFIPSLQYLNGLQLTFPLSTQIGYVSRLWNYFLWQCTYDKHQQIKRRIWDWFQCDVPHKWIQIFFNAGYLNPNILFKTILYKFYIFGPKGHKFEVFSWEPNINTL